MPAFIADIPIQECLRVLVIDSGHLRVLRLIHAVPGTVQQKIVLFVRVLL